MQALPSPPVMTAVVVQKTLEGGELTGLFASGKRPCEAKEIMIHALSGYFRPSQALFPRILTALHEGLLFIVPKHLLLRCRMHACLCLSILFGPAQVCSLLLALTLMHGRMPNGCESS